MAERLSAGPGEALNRDRRITITVDGRSIPAFDGDTVGSAMAAAGVTTFSRSFKYHRPRGLSCMTGACPNCLVTVDGVPNVRACLEPVRPGMTVAAAERVAERRPRRHGRARLGVVHDAAGLLLQDLPQARGSCGRWSSRSSGGPPGLGKVPRDEDHEHLQKVHLHPEVLVVGGGPAGLAAAAEAAQAGADVVLIESSSEPGGHLRSSAAEVPATTAARAPGGRPRGPWPRRPSQAGAQLLTGVTAFGVFEAGLVAAFDAGHLYRIRPQQTVFATGAYDQPAVFPNNDLPGIMLSGAVDRLLHLYRVLPGRLAVVAAFDAEAYRTAEALARAGAGVVVLDPRPDLDREAPRSTAVTAAGATVLHGTVVTRADGGAGSGRSASAARTVRRRSSRPTCW